MNKKWTKLKVYNSVLRGNVSTFVNLILTNITDIVIAILFPLLFKFVVDIAFYNRDSVLFYKLMIGITVVFVCRLLVFFIMDLSWNSMRMKFKHFASLKTYQSIMRMTAKAFKKYSVGDLLERINRDSESFWNQFFWSGVYLIVPALYVLSISIVLFTLNIRIALITISTSLFSVILSRVLGNQIKHIQQEIAKKNATYISWLYNALSGIREIIMFCAKKSFKSTFVKKTINIIRLNIKISKKEFFFNRTNSFMRFALTVITYIVCAYGIFNDEITLGSFVAITQYITLLNNNFDELIRFILSYKKNNIYIDRVLQIWEEPSEFDLNVGLEFPDTIEKIEFINVSFSYDTDNLILNNLNLTINRDQIVSITGMSGTGKSTLLYLIVRLYEPNTGCIRINNIDIRRYSIKSLREKIGIVFQEPWLFADTLTYNLQNTDETLDESVLIENLKKARIYDYVSTLPKGLDSVLKRDTLTLSRGQMQRVVLARILSKNPKIFLADEATVSIEREAEDEILSCIKSLKNTISIFVTHQENTMKKSDKVIVIKKGKVIAEGSYSEIKNWL